jgi:anaerobic selenocysteine-containing dehydrogenase
LNPDPLVEIHPETADYLGVGDGDWVWIETGNGRIQMRARLFDGIAPNVVSAQHAWWFPEESAPEHGWKKSSVNLLFGEDSGYDPETGSECIRSTLCRVEPCAPQRPDSR